MTKRFVRRKWGWYFVLLDRKHFKVKLLRFKEGASLSKQYHKMRSELWLFLKGSGQFWNGGEENDWGFFNVYNGDVVLTGVRNWHKYEAGRTTWALEIQYGERCVEEDIVRA